MDEENLDQQLEEARSLCLGYDLPFEVLDQLTARNKKLAVDLTNAEAEILRLKAEHEEEATAMKLKLTEMQIQFAIDRDSCEPHEQMVELDLAIQELSKWAVELQSDLMRERIMRENESRKYSRQTENFEALETQTATLRTLFDEQVKINQLNDQITKVLEDLQESVQRENAQLKYEAECLKSALKESVLKLTKEKKALEHVLTNVEEERLRLEVIVREMDKSRKNDPMEQTQYPQKNTQNAPEDSVWEAQICELQTKLALMEAKVQLQSVKAAELETFSREKALFLQRYEEMTEEHSAMDQKYANLSEECKNMRLVIAELKQQLTRAERENENHCIAPPTIAGLELRRCQMANRKLQSECLQREAAEAELHWAHITLFDLKLKEQNITEQIKIDRLLEVRKKIVETLIRNPYLDFFQSNDKPPTQRDLLRLNVEQDHEITKLGIEYQLIRRRKNEIINRSKIPQNALHWCTLKNSCEKSLKIISTFEEAEQIVSSLYSVPTDRCSPEN